MLKAA
jgi:electron transfer flavoprotein alpha subunit